MRIQKQKSTWQFSDPFLEHYSQRSVCYTFQGLLSEVRHGLRGRKKKAEAAFHRGNSRRRHRELAPRSVRGPKRATIAPRPF